MPAAPAPTSRMRTAVSFVMRVHCNIRRRARSQGWRTRSIAGAAGLAYSVRPRRLSTMELVDIVYLASFFLGLGFAVVSALMSGVFSGGAEAHVGAGHDV